MKHQRLKDQISGCLLKEEYLEAFLLQGAYIESLLKLFAGFKVFVSLQKDEGKPEDKLLGALGHKVKNYGMFELIELLSEAELVSGDEKASLHKYREKRNNVLHDLLKEIKKEGFDDELREICLEGKKLIESSVFSRISGTLVDVLERKKEPPPSIPIQQKLGE